MEEVLKRLQDCAQDPDVPIIYLPKFREYGIDILDGGQSFLVFSYCPFTGIRLPKSLRDEWFDTIEKLDIDPEDSDIPEKFKTDQWWRERLRDSGS